MKTLYLDCGMGAAGDMLSAALINLLPEPEKMLDELNSLGIPGVEYRLKKAKKCGVTGYQMEVFVNGVREDEIIHEHEHHHEHTHEHSGGHSHSHGGGMSEIEHIVNGHMNAPEEVKEDILSVYGIIAGAESLVHGESVQNVHFSEVGAMDAVADIAAVCLIMRKLSPDRVVASPVHVGSGRVKCAHGILPVPAPATAYILSGIPIYGGEIDGELCTPTGAALLKEFVQEFGDMPVMTVEKIGYGMGKKDFVYANCVRAILGEEKPLRGKVIEIMCNVDDMTAEEIGFALEMMLEGGALEAFTTPAGMKKNRPGVLFTVLCEPQNKEKIEALIFKHTSTIGIRECEKERKILERETIIADTEYGSVRIKKSSGGGFQKEKYEFDDLAHIARERGISLREAKNLVDGGE